MRTTLDLDDDILQAVKELASARGVTAGRMLSDLARKALQPAAETARVRNGIQLMPRRPAGSPPITMKMVNELRDEL
jgi:hypothetical protein